MIAGGLKSISIMGTMREVGYWEGAVDEHTPTNPISLYGIAKDALRNMTFNLTMNKDVSVHWLRAYYIMGDDLKNNSIFSKLVQAEQEGKEKFPFTSGKNKYDIITVQELAKQIVAASVQDQITGIINVCTGEPISLADKVESFIKENDFKIKNGLIKSATENYTTIYAFLISLQLIVTKNDVYDNDIEYLINAPVRLSDEDNIREFYDKCIFENGWKLKESISDIRSRIQTIGLDSIKQFVKRWEGTPKENSNIYFGKYPFLFISYAHTDKDMIYPIIEGLQKKGVRIWYDTRLRPGDEWPEEIGWNIIDCALFIVMLSDAAVLSIHVREELNMANSRHKNLFGVNFKNIQLSPGMELQLSISQMINGPLSEDQMVDSIFSIISNKYPDLIEKPSNFPTL